MSETKKPLRAAIVGLGIGHAHAQGYLKTPDATLVAVCDMHEARLNERAEQYGLPPAVRYTNYKQMLAEMPLDLVSVCLPNALHAEVTLAALEAGAHVLCEKPMAPTVAEAQQMLQTAKLRDRQLMIAYNHRYRADTYWIKRMIDEGRLGKIYHVEAWWRRETGIPGSGWFSQHQLAGGGSLIDLGVHILDTALWLMNFPTASTVSGSVSSHFGPRGLKVWGNPRWMGDVSAPAFDVEDAGVGFVRFENGANMILHATWAEHRAPQDDLMRLEIEGTEGSVVLNIPNYTRNDTLRYYTEMAGQAVTVQPTIRWNGKWDHEGLVEATCHALRTGDTPPTTGVQGMAAIRILAGIYESARTGREVVLETSKDLMA